MSIFKTFCLVGLLLAAGCSQPPDPMRPVSTRPDGTVSGASGSFGTLISRERSRRGLGKLQVSSKLSAAAQAHANDMSRRGFFSHTSSDGRTIGQRVAATGYGHCWVSENISWNRSTEAEAFARWMASPGHRRNMLARDPTEYGLAVAPGNYRVLVLGRPGC